MTNPSPVDDWPVWLARRDVPTEDKVARLAEHVAAHGTLPAGCDFLWSETSKLLASGRSSAAVLPQLFPRLAPKQLAVVVRAAPETNTRTLFAGLIAGSLQEASLKPVLSAFVRVLDEEQLGALLRSLGQLAGLYPADEPMMGQRLLAMLRKLPQDPARFSQHLAAIRAGARWLPQGDDRVRAWRQFHETFERFVRACQQRTSLLTASGAQSEREDAAQQLVVELSQAMPADWYPDDKSASAKRQLLVGLIAAAKLPASSLPKDFEGKVAGYFQTGKWAVLPRAPNPQPKPLPQPKPAPVQAGTPTTSSSTGNTSGVWWKVLVGFGVGAVVTLLGLMASHSFFQGREDVASRRQAPATPAAEPSASPAPEAAAAPASKPAAGSPGKQKTPTESKPATAPAVEPAASKKSDASSPKPGQSPPAATGDGTEPKAPSSDPYVDGFKTKAVPAEAGPMAPAESGIRPDVKSADGNSVPFPPPLGDIGPGPTPRKPQARTPEEAKASGKKPEVELAPPTPRPSEDLPPAVVAEAPKDNLWFDPKTNPVTALRDLVPGEIDIRLHGSEFFTRIREAHRQDVPPATFVVGLPPKAGNARSVLQVQVVYEGRRNPDAIASFIVQPKPPQLNCRVFQKEEDAFEGKLQRQALQYSVLELVPTNPEEKHVWLALVKPIRPTFTLNEKGEAFVPCENFRNAVPAFVDWSRLYLGPGKVVGPDGREYTFGDSWQTAAPRYEWAVSDPSKEFGLLDLSVRTTAVKEQLKLQLTACFPDDLRQTKSRSDQLKNEKQQIETLLEKSNKDPPSFEVLRSREYYGQLTDWCNTTADLVRLSRIADPRPIPQVPTLDELERWRKNPILHKANIDNFDGSFSFYRRWVRGALAPASHDRAVSLQQEIDGTAAKHGERWTEAVAKQEEFASWLKNGVKIRAFLYRLVPYGALGHERQDGDPDHIRVIVIEPD